MKWGTLNNPGTGEMLPVGAFRDRSAPPGARSITPRQFRFGHPDRPRFRGLSKAFRRPTSARPAPRRSGGRPRNMTESRRPVGPLGGPCCARQTGYRNVLYEASWTAAEPPRSPRPLAVRRKPQLPSWLPGVSSS